jgi:predicted DNA-binding transcriptional regulator AlpA
LLYLFEVFLVTDYHQNPLIQALETTKMDNKTVLRRKDLTSYLNVSMPTVDRMLRDKVLPKIHITQKCVGVLRTDVDAYLLENKTQ